MEKSDPTGYPFPPDGGDPVQCVHILGPDGKCSECGAPLCSICGRPMEPSEAMFKFHGYSGPCPQPPLPKTDPAPKGDDGPPVIHTMPGEDLSPVPDATVLLYADGQEIASASFAKRMAIEIVAKRGLRPL